MLFKTMLQWTSKLSSIGIGLCLVGCVNNGQKLPVPIHHVVVGAGVGAGIGAAAGSATGNTVTGLVVGGVVGSVLGLYHHDPQEIIRQLSKRGIKYYEYGDTHLLIVPTDRYFEFETHRFNDQCYPGLMNIARLLRYYPCSVFYVAGFTDDIGTRDHNNKLSQARADAMVTFLWAHDIRAQKLRAEGYGDQFSVGDNHLIHGSAYNRRIEIEWVNIANCSKPPRPDAVDSQIDGK